MAQVGKWAAENKGWLIIVGLIAIIYALFRPAPSELTDGALEAVLGSGQPVVVEFYSTT